MITNSISEMSFAEERTALKKTDSAITNNNSDCENKNVISKMTTENGHRFNPNVSSENAKECVVNSAFESKSRELINSSTNSYKTIPSPKRTQLSREQESALQLQCITDVHNYAKLNRCVSYENCRTVSSSNSSNQDEEEEDDEEDDEDDEEEVDHDDEYYSTEDYVYRIRQRCIAGAKRKAQSAYRPTPIKSIKLEPVAEVKTPPKSPDSVEEDEARKTAPDHHARRPMNAFLIFCKRHRAIVRDKHKHLENRSITKILGDWWASLDTAEKTCYTNLAKQYKDAFLSANPNFKWYKLPAPSLRTLVNPRPNAAEHELTTTRHEHVTADSAPDHQYSKPCNTVGSFKFADETQLGGLSALMLDGTPDSMRTKADTSEHMTNGNIQKVLNRDSSFSSSEDDLHSTKKSSRSCKGKKYQELMNSGQLASVTKKSKATKTKPETAPAVKQHANVHDSSSDSSDQKLIVVDSPEPAGKATPLSPSTSPHKFDTISFDLEEKIKALPALCFDDYVQRKRSTKKKKKINSKKSRNNATASAAAQQKKAGSKSALEVREQIRGSQRRKARKESITRRDVNAIQNEVELMQSFVQDLNGAIAKRSNEPTPPVVAETPLNDIGTVNNETSTSDLFILAEVASNHIDTKI